MERNNKVLLIYTGGTIGMGRNPKTGALEPLDFCELTDSLPEFAYIKTDVDSIQFNPPIDEPLFCNYTFPIIPISRFTVN